MLTLRGMTILWLDTRHVLRGNPAAWGFLLLAAIGFCEIFVASTFRIHTPPPD